MKRLLLMLALLAALALPACERDSNYSPETQNAERLADAPVRPPHEREPMAGCNWDPYVELREVSMPNAKQLIVRVYVDESCTSMDPAIYNATITAEDYSFQINTHVSQWRWQALADLDDIVVTSELEGYEYKFTFAICCYDVNYIGDAWVDLWVNLNGSATCCAKSLHLAWSNVAVDFTP